MKTIPILPETVQDRAFFASLELFSQLLSHKYGISVTFNGGKAHTDWENNINLPEYTLHLRGAEGQLLALGYVHHELSHVICGSAKSAAGLNPFEFKIMNTLADARDEVYLTARYPGCRKPLFNLVDTVFSKNARELKGQSAVALGFMLVHVRHYVYRLFAERLENLAGQFDKYFGAELRKKIEEASEKAVVATSSEEVSRAAVQIASWFAELAKCHKKETPQRASARSGDSLPASNNKSQQSHGDKPAGAGKEAQYAANADVFINDPGLQKSVTAKDIVTQTIAREKAEAVSKGEYQEEHTHGISAKKGSSGKPLAKAASSGVTAYNEALDSRLVLDSTVVLRTKLHAMFKKTERVVSRPARHGRLDVRRMTRAMLGYDDVFKKTTEVQKVNTAVHLLVDCSGTMRHTQPGQNHPNIEMALAAAECMATVCRSLSKNVNLAVTAFPSIKGNEYVDELLKHGSLLRNGAMWKRKASGNTPLAGALLFAMMKLQLVRNSRKMVIILSDGAADFPEDVARVVRGGTRQGLECRGLSLYGDYMADFLPKQAYSVIESAADIAQGYFDIFKGLLK